MTSIHRYQSAPQPISAANKKRPAGVSPEERVAKIARTIEFANAEVVQYQKKMSHWKIGTPILTPGGDREEGTFKVARETGVPGTIALVSSVYQSRRPYQDARLAEKELSLIRRLQGTPHIPKLLDAFSLSNNEYTMIQEHVGPNLFTVFLDSNNPQRKNISLSEIEVISKKILEALNDLHTRKKVVHGDVKPANCSVTGSLFDFNLSEIVNERGFVPGRRYGDGYHPPENLLLDIAYPASDMWAFGSMLYELSIGTPFMHTEDGEDHLQYKINALHCYSDRLGIGYNSKILPLDCLENGALKPSTTPQCNRLQAKLEHLKNLPKGVLLADLITRLLRYHPEERITAAEALKHPFFTQTPQDRSFHLQIQGKEKLNLKIFNNEFKIDDIFNLPLCPPNSCCHINPSTQPQCIELIDQETSQPILHGCNFPFYKDHLILSVDTNRKQITLINPSPMDAAETPATSTN